MLELGCGGYFLVVKRPDPYAYRHLYQVLELGCGHGLPGVWYLRRNLASSVAFSDFNREARTPHDTPRDTA